MSRVISTGMGRERAATEAEELQFDADEAAFVVQQAALTTAKQEAQEQQKLASTLPLTRLADVVDELAGAVDAAATPKLQALVKELRETKSGVSNGSSEASPASSR